MKIFTGKVVATKTAKTATVAVERMTIHPLYKKRMKRNRNYKFMMKLGLKSEIRLNFPIVARIPKPRNGK